jgi:uncharacterized protein YfeS
MANNKDYVTEKIRITVTEDVESIRYATVDEAIKIMQKVRTKLKKQGCTNIRMEIDAEIGWDYDSQRAYLTTQIRGDRLETDEEHAKRVQLEEDRLARWDSERREQYERLKKLYEP